MNVLKKILELNLRYMAIFALFIHSPKIIAITGSVGKTTTKDFLASILKESKKSLRFSKKSYNSEYGIPLSILGMSSGGREPIKWLIEFSIGFWNMFFNMPKYIILEIGLEFPNDIYKVSKWLHPDIALITQLAKVPVHSENFNSKEELHNEKFLLLKSIKQGGTALYNGNDFIQKQLIDKSDIKATDFNSIAILESHNTHYDESNNPIGTDAIINVKGKQETFYIPEVLGGGIAQSLTTAIAIAITIDPNIEIKTIRKAAASKKPTPGRMRILKGKNGSTIIDDSYNASPIATAEALTTLGLIENKKKVAVLGIMLQLGDDEKDAHTQIGKMAEDIASHIITVGDTPYNIGEACKTHEDVINKCIQLANKDTIFLFKGSQVSRVEKIVKSLIDEAINPADTLVRQEKNWK